MGRKLKGIGAKPKTKENNIEMQKKIFSGPELTYGQKIEMDWR